MKVAERFCANYVVDSSVIKKDEESTTVGTIA